MSLQAREKYKSLIDKLPFQYLADTPTVRYYTDWKAFEARMDKGYAYNEHPLPPQLSNHNPNIILGTTLRVNQIPGQVEVIDISRDESPIEPMSLVGVSTKMHAYHAYMWTTGAYIRVSPGEETSLTVATTSGDGYLGHHIILDIGRGARLDLKLLDYAGDSESLKTLIVEVIARENSKLDATYLTLHHPSHAVYKILHAKLHEGANVEARGLTAGGAMTRYEETYILEGRRSKLDARASNVARNGTKTDFLLNALHKGPESEGFISARGVVLTNGYLAQRGLAKIDAEAQWASSEVESHVTILGEPAKGYAIPMLEIHSGDVVKANHEASVTTIQEDHVFYMKSRGLSREELEKLMITGIIEYSGAAGRLGLGPTDIF
ncbi:MAG: SufD family Fe-S cluster assembly protein [Desulfurococcales archaeon]|nr:SufD family Fe-S cluster assembly protein [Desulfurococcales archaeon]MCE4605383.1 SufD family Fe-S cluster assembly protein [Desulfurococcales archaeon]